MSLFENFLGDSASARMDKVRAGVDLLGHALPWVIGTGFVLGGAYGLNCYLGVDFARQLRSNLKEAKLLSDFDKSWYTFWGGFLGIGGKVITEEEYNKIINKNRGKISDNNSVLASWKSIYSK